MRGIVAFMLAATLAGAGVETELPVETETEHVYSDNDLYVLSHIISAESGNCSEEMMIAVGSVVLNRVADERFPDSIEEVVFQKGQYSPTWNGAYFAEPTDGALEVAKMLLEQGSQLDASVVWQAEFRQGNGVYEIIDSPWGTQMYFCY